MLASQSSNLLMTQWKNKREKGREKKELGGMA
jgi:hypothetical protein